MWFDRGIVKMQTSENFYLTLIASSSSPHITKDLIYTTKPLPSFTTSLNPYLYFEENNYEVAVVQISGNTILENVNNGTEYRLTFFLRNNAKYRYSSSLSFCLPNGEYKDTFEVINCLNKQIIQEGFNDVYLDVYNFETRKYVNTDLPDDNDPNDCILRITNRQLSSEESEHIRKPIKPDIYEDIEYVQFEDCLQNIFVKKFRSKVNTPIPKDDVSAYRLVSFTPRSNNLVHLYSDLVEYQHFGSHRAKLLRSFVLASEEKSDYFCIEFFNPHYVRVEGAHHRSITIDIKDSNDRYVSFASGTLLVKLHFRRVEGYYER